MGSPYPASLSASDYCQSAAGEGYGGSSQDLDVDAEHVMTGIYGEEGVEGELDEDAEEDLSSEPPPQRSDGVSTVGGKAASVY